MSPFIENISNAIWDAYNANLFEDCIQYTQTLHNDFEESLSNEEKQDNYWYFISCHLKLNSLQEAEASYVGSKNLFLEHGFGDIDATESFISNAKLYFSSENYSDSNELKWFLAEKSFKEIKPLPYALITFLFAELLAQKNQLEEAKTYLEQGIALFSIHKKDAGDKSLKKFRKAKLLYTQITGNKEFIKIDPSSLFDIDFVPNKEYLLHSNQNHQNCLRIKDFVTTLNAAEEPFDFWIDNDIYIRFAKSNDGSINVYNTYISNNLTKNNFYFAATEMFKGIFFKKAEYDLTAYTEKEDDESMKFNLIYESSIDFKEQQLEGLKWWNEICNRFYTIFPDRDF